MTAKADQPIDMDSGVFPLSTSMDWSPSSGGGGSFLRQGASCSKSRVAVCGNGRGASEAQSHLSHRTLLGKPARGRTVPGPPRLNAGAGCTDSSTRSLQAGPGQAHSLIRSRQLYYIQQRRSRSRTRHGTRMAPVGRGAVGSASASGLSEPPSFSNAYANANAVRRTQTEAVGGRQRRHATARSRGPGRVLYGAGRRFLESSSESEVEEEVG
ncbi:hypothetical protein JB92DRAFT_2829139 [Gautieria morchelliformis]|nr:hypothetical protein JB92DRAFT_2829139 [Gautieria morchelliformis]